MEHVAVIIGKICLVHSIQGHLAHSSTDERVIYANVFDCKTIKRMTEFALFTSAGKSGPELPPSAVPYGPGKCFKSSFARI